MWIKLRLKINYNKIIKKLKKSKLRKKITKMIKIKFLANF